MATATVTPTIDAFPNGVEALPGTMRFRGSLTFSSATDTYVTNGLAFSLASTGQPYTENAPVDCQFASPSTGLSYIYDKSHHTIRIFTTYGTEITNGTQLGSTVGADTVNFTATCMRTP